MYFDIAMPLTVFGVTLFSVLLSEKFETKLKTIFEERQITTRDAVLLVTLMVVMITIMALGAQHGLVNPLIVLFLFSCSALLFVFSYVFSNKRWYLAALPPAIFVALYFLLKDTIVWALYLANIYAIIFAIFAILYLGSIFEWKSTMIFAVLITAVDAIMVFVTKYMVDFARTGLALRLPLAVILPLFPPVAGIDYPFALGLGDFFLAGLLSIQMLKKYGKKSAVLSAITISIAFFLFEALYLIPATLHNIEVFFPATIIVILGWLPIVLVNCMYGIKKEKLW